MSKYIKPGKELIAEIVRIIKDNGPLTPAEIAVKLSRKTLPTEELEQMEDGQYIEVIDGFVCLYAKEGPDALDKWFTSWVRPSNTYVPGSRLCNALTNGVGGWGMMG